MSVNLLGKIKKIQSYCTSIHLKKSAWVKVAVDYAASKLLYGFSIEDYFLRGNGYTLSKYAKKRFFTLKRAFELQEKVNHPDYIHFLENKAEALNLFKDLISRKWLYVPKSSYTEFVDFCKATPIFISKPIGGMCGEGIEKHIVDCFSDEELKELWNRFVADDILIEECIKAHDDIYLGSAALSTFRIFTMIDRKGDVHILKAKYRVGIGDSIVDTADGESVHYPISIKYGIVEGPGINEFLKEHYYYHPGCDKLVVGMKIPKWDQVIDIVTKAAKKIPQVRYIGWDIAITNNSVEIIEGNHNPHQGTFEIMGQERLWWPKLKSLM